MRTALALLAVASCCTVACSAACTAAMAGNVAVHQAGRANVYGLVQAGRRPSQVDVEQRGAYNVLGVMQATPNAGLSAVQRGGANLAVVGQFGLPSRFRMP